MRRGNRFNLEDVLSHLRGRDASLRWMDTSHGVPLKDSANRRGEILAITITVSTDVAPIRPMLSTLEDLGMKTVLLAANSRGTGPPASLCREALNKIVEPNPPAHQ